MSYELRLPPDTQREIEAYIANRFGGAEAQLAAWNEIERELEKLAANPWLGTTYPGGPFERRPIYRFVIHPDGTKRYLQVVYKVHEADQVVVISGFQPVSL